MPGHVLLELEGDPRRCRVFAEGWQSWTPTTTYSLAEMQWGPVRPETWRWGYGGTRPRPPARAGVFQGEGLLIVDPGTGSDVVSVGALSAAEEIPVVRCERSGSRGLVVSADSPEVDVARTAARGG